MSFYTPPILPPVFSDPGLGGAPGGSIGAPTPPFGGTATIGGVNAPGSAPVSAYVPGPYCFGIDQSLCSALPVSIHLGGGGKGLMGRMIPGVDIPVQQFCQSIANAVCLVLVAAILLVILGIAVYGLIN